MRAQYENEIRKLNLTIDTLNNEVNDQSRLRFEIENGYDRFNELMASLLSNLGESLMQMQSEMRNQGIRNQ